MSRTFIVREEIANVVGLNAAIIHERLKYMAEQNFREGRNQHEGSTWVASTYEQWAEYIPVLSAKQIRTAFTRLIEAGLVKTGNFNKHNTDRKLWYALTEEAQYFGSPDLPQRADGFAPEGKSGFAPEGRCAFALEGRSYKEEDSLRTPQEDQSATPRVSFAEFWRVWPNRVSKQKAETAWKKLSVENKRLAVELAERFFLQWRASHPNASAIHPASYLNGKRWEDVTPQEAASSEGREEQIQKMLNSSHPGVREAARKMLEKIA